jgi:hypothetical protein
MLLGVLIATSGHSTRIGSFLVVGGLVSGVVAFIVMVIKRLKT